MLTMTIQKRSFMNFVKIKVWSILWERRIWCIWCKERLNSGTAIVRTWHCIKVIIIIPRHIYMMLYSYSVLTAALSCRRKNVASFKCKRRQRCFYCHSISVICRRSLFSGQHRSVLCIKFYAPQLCLLFHEKNLILEHALDSKFKLQW